MVQQVWGGFCPFLGQSPCSPSTVRVKLQSGGMAGLGHALLGKSSAGNSLAACGVMVCSPYNCREADWLARAEPFLLRCTTTRSLEWGPGGWTHSYSAPVTRYRGHCPDGHCVTQAGDEALFPLSVLWSPFFWGSSFQIFGVVPGSDNPENPEFKHVP